jgi:hypothetical protein
VSRGFDVTQDIIPLVHTLVELKADFLRRNESLARSELDRKKSDRVEAEFYSKVWSIIKNLDPLAIDVGADEELSFFRLEQGFSGGMGDWKYTHNDLLAWARTILKARRGLKGLPMVCSGELLHL